MKAKGHRLFMKAFNLRTMIHFRAPLKSFSRAISSKLKTTWSILMKTYSINITNSIKSQ